MVFSPRHLTTSDLFVRWLPQLAFIAVIANHLWFVYSHAINIPYQDGIYDFLRFVNLVEAADGAKGVFFAELFEQYIFHRTSTQRLFVYVAYLVEGEVNFRTLTILANLVVSLILLLFYLSVRGEKYRWIWLLVSALLLLHLRTYTLVLWSQPAFPYYSVFFFAFAGLFALHKVTIPKLLLAGILCTFSAFSYASGQVVWLLGLASLLHQCLISGRRSLIYPAIWLLIAITVLIVWSVDYTGGSVTGNTYLGLNLNPLSLPDQLYDAPLYQVMVRYAAFFLVMLGSAFTNSSAWGAGTAGLIVLAVLSFISVRFLKQEDIRLALCCWFAVASATAVTAGRAIWLSPEYILVTRYSFLSVILVSTLALLLQTKFKLFKTPLVYPVILLAGTYWVWAHRHFEGPLQNFMNERYKAFNNERYPVLGRPSTETAAVVREAISTGLYKPPCRPFPECEASSKSEESIYK